MPSKHKPTNQNPTALAADLAEELAGSIRVREGRREVLMTRQRAILKAITAAAIGGDIQAAGLLLTFAARILGAAASDEAEDSVADQVLLEDFVSREIARRGASDTKGEEEPK